jgi:hypothetical protein
MLVEILLFGVGKLSKANTIFPRGVKNDHLISPGD